MTTAEEQDFLEEIQKSFLEEVTFLLESCEESYLKLEVPELRTEELSNIFRLAHSLKGGGAAVGFTDLAGFAHVVEDCLSLLRTYPDQVNTDVISLLLKSGDAFKEQIDLLKRKDPSPWNVELLKQEIAVVVAAIKEKTGCATAPVSDHHTDEAAPVVEASAPVAAPEAPKEEKVDDLNDDEKWQELAKMTDSQLAPPSNVIPIQSAAPAAASAAPPNGGGSGAAKTGASASAQGATVKVDADRIDNLLNIVGELVVTKSQLMTRCEGHAADLELNAVVSLMDKIIRELQDRTLSMRMTPLKGLFLKTQRIIRDLSIKLNKPIEFDMFGEETEIDRNMVELLGDPLMHMVRNSLDHGIEKPELRRSLNKPEKGSISVSAKQAGGRVVVCIKDDGGGMNRERILQKAIEKGLVASSADPAKISDKQVFGFIFAPGFSTAETVTDLSGRGVGMDVVKTNIEKMKGTIEIESTPAVGTTLTISIPLTTSITDGMMVQVDDEVYVIPMDNIRELVNLDSSRVAEVSPGKHVFNARDQVIPLLRLSTALKCHPVKKVENIVRTAGSHAETLVIVDVGSGRFALGVEKVLGQTQVVLKSLGQGFPPTDGVAGAAILGDGRVALVLDPEGIVQSNVSSRRRQIEAVA